MIRALNLENVFLVDGAGALVSALCLGALLPRLEAWIGMPTAELYLLAGIAALFALNAALAHRLGGARRAPWLRVTILANLSYCVLTGSLVALRFGELEALGVAYFLGEIGIILALVAAEAAVLRAARAAA